MAYSDNPGSMDPPMASASEGSETPHDEGMHQGGEEESSLFLTADMLPPGMKLNAGDILEFKVVNPSDADGHIEVVYNHGEGKEEKGASWEDDFRSEMSPRKGEDGGGMEGSPAGGGY